MTIPELIAEVLQVIRNQFYADRPAREFLRDERYLVGALGTYGYECAQRGWSFDVPFIQRELLGLLQTFKRQNIEARWMPIYLQNAIRRHIGQRAEELRASQCSVPRCTRKVVDGVQPVVVIEKTPIETLAAVYQDIRRQRRTQRAALAPKAVRKLQGELL